MTLWFIRGIRRGVVTTRYPARPDASARFLPAPPAFRPQALTRVTAGRLVTVCPPLYPYGFFAEVGRLLSYGTDLLDNVRSAATYVDRILRGAKPSELPVQAPVKFELVINMKTAQALGLDVPLLLQQRADQVIE